MINILLIEDEPGVYITLGDRLKAEGYDVTIKDNGITGEAEAIKGDYNLILLDIMLPGRDGYKVCENIRANNIDTPIIMLTARGSDLDTVIGLRQGADDYVSKPFDMTVLLARIEALLRRTNKKLRLEDGVTLLFGDFKLDTEKGLIFFMDKEIILNTLEYRLLEFLVTNPDKVITRNEILDVVWGYDSESTSRTVDVHIAKIRQKLGDSFHKYLVTVRGRGYRFSLK